MDGQRFGLYTNIAYLDLQALHQYKAIEYNVGVDGVAHGHEGDVRGGGKPGIKTAGEVVALPAVLVVLVARVVAGGGVEAVAALAAKTSSNACTAAD